MSIPPAAGFPNETWLEILECLPRSHLKRVASTSKRFLALSRPLLFKNINVKLCYEAYAVPRATALPSKLGLLEEKLRLFTSVEIARSVRNLVVRCACRQHRQPSPSSGVEPSCNALASLLFLHLPQFHAVKYLELSFLVLEADNIARLQLLPSLKHLYISFDNRELNPLHGDVPMVSVPSASLDLSVRHESPAGRTARESPSLLRFLDMLDPGTLRKLEVYCSHSAPKDMARITRFSGLQLLAIHAIDSEFDTISFEFGALTPDTFPQLHELEIHGTNLPDSLLVNCPLRKLHVESNDLFAYMPHWHEASCAKILELELDRLPLSLGDLESLERFSSLKKLSIDLNIDQDCFDNGRYTIAEPCFRVHWSGFRLSVYPDFADPESQAAKQLQSLISNTPFWCALLESILVRCPDLRHIWMETYDLPPRGSSTFNWRRAEDGTAHMEFSQDPEIVDEMQEAEWERKTRNKARW
uniref:F-box domain-containing protein n=1 Tax=Mycena chlorophos TaxID=658473 RepID=A0ABQ0L5D6_MYCCL|nr:predicted protein [Mycena chlorophos]